MNDCRLTRLKDSKDYPAELRIGEGLVGQCAADKRTMLITEMRAGTVPIKSALFEAIPRSIIVLPVLFEITSRPLSSSPLSVSSPTCKSRSSNS